MCSQFMRHSKRGVLTGEDVQHALKWYGEQPVDGFGPSCGKNGIDGFTFSDEAEAFVATDNNVDLAQLALDDDQRDDQREEEEALCIKAVWLSIEGYPVSEEDGGTSCEQPQIGGLSQTLTQYFQATTDALLGDEEELVQVDGV